MWRVEFDPTHRELTVRIADHATQAALTQLGIAQAEALEATGNATFRVLYDVRHLFPLEPDEATMFQDIKRAATELPSCAGVVVLSNSPTIAMQQYRTRVAAELVTMDLDEVAAFLARES